MRNYEEEDSSQLSSMTTLLSAVEENVGTAKAGEANDLAEIDMAGTGAWASHVPAVSAPGVNVAVYEEVQEMVEVANTLQTIGIAEVASAQEEFEQTVEAAFALSPISPLSIGSPRTSRHRRNRSRRPRGRQHGSRKFYRSRRGPEGLYLRLN